MFYTNKESPSILQAGALWHLLTFFFDYDVTLAESGVAADETTSKKAVCNRLARLAVTAAARMAGLPEAPAEGEADEESMKALAPKNQVIEESLAAMLSLHIVSK